MMLRHLLSQHQTNPSMAGKLVKQLAEGLAKRLKDDTFDRLMSNLKFISAGDGSVVCEMTVEDRHRNQMGTLHGGMTATLVDNVTSYALLTKNCRGVSVDLSVSYLAAVSVGEEIVLDARVVKMGRNVAFATLDVREKVTNRLVATGRHTKFVG